MKYLFAIALLVLSVSCSSDSQSENNDILWAGQWLRTDGTYQLVVEQQQDGSLTGTYLNPRPVNVQKVEVQLKGEREHLVVILNDVGYPGAVYDLVYSPTADRLVGTYFNPGAGQTYDVSFTRQP